MERNLLLVDDEPNIIRSLVRLLRRDGYNIVTANSGKEGLELLEQHRDVGVIISDQRMPEMNGTEFLSLVKDKFPNNVRIVLSGFTDLKSVTDSINEGAIYKFLTKPWDDDLLRKNVESAFEHYELTEENKRLQGQLQKLNMDLQRLNVELQNTNEELATTNKELESHIIEKVRQVSTQNKTISFAHEVLDNLPFAVFGVDLNDMIVMANKKADSLLAAPGEILMGALAYDVLPESVVAPYGRWLDNNNETEITTGHHENDGLRMIFSMIANETGTYGRLLTVFSTDEYPCTKLSL